VARSMSVWYFNKMCRVAAASSSPISLRPSTTSVRAQSSVSATDGAFFRSSDAQRAHDLGDLLGQGRLVMPGTRERMMSRSRSTSG
jgi:hypothetical protein